MRMFNTKDAVRFCKEEFGWRSSPNSWTQWRCQGRGPEYFRLPGSNRVFYTEESLRNFIQSNVGVKTIDSVA